MTDHGHKPKMKPKREPGEPCPCHLPEADCWIWTSYPCETPVVPTPDPLWVVEYGDSAQVGGGGSR
jgi:hypothetical protein